MRRYSKKLLYLRRTSQSTEDLEGFYDALSMLGSDIISYFEHEEAIFRFLGMPESEVQSHFQAHEEIVEQYAELNLGLMQGCKIRPGDILAMIQEWIARCDLGPRR